MEWYGCSMIWYGIGWHGMVRCGMARDRVGWVGKHTRDEIHGTVR